MTRGGPYNLGRGGGIEFAGSNLTIENTTIANNIAPVQGGGLWVNTNTSSLRIVNSTVSGNQAVLDAGGGMFLNSADGRPVNIINSSIVKNLAGRDAGGIWTGGLNRDDVKLTNTLFAGNTATTSLQGHTNFTLMDGGGNIVQTIVGGRGPLVTQNSRYVPDLKLGALQWFGNDYVHPLLTGSPAINAGTLNEAPRIDQRGIARDSLPDSGAFEFKPTTITARALRVTERSSTQEWKRSLPNSDPLKSDGVNAAIDANDALLTNVKATHTQKTLRTDDLLRSVQPDLLQSATPAIGIQEKSPFMAVHTLGALQAEEVNFSFSEKLQNQGSFAGNTAPAWLAARLF